MRVALSDAVWWSAGAALAFMLLMPPHKTGDRLGLRRFVTPEVSSEWRVGQRFRMNAPELNGISIRAVAVGSVSGRFRLTVRDRDARDVERSGYVSAEALVRDDHFTFMFEPIEDSTDHEYQFDIVPAPDMPGRGVALRATKGPRPEGFALRINNAPRWASLAFQTHTPSVSSFRSLIGARDPDRPPRWLALLGLFGVWISMRWVLRAVRRREEPPIDAKGVA